MNQDEESKAKTAQFRDELQLEISRLNNMNSSGSGMSLEELIKERNRLQLEISISRSNLSAINQELAKLNSSITEFSVKETKLAELERDLKNISDELQNAQERYNNALTQVSVIGTSLKQVIEGQPADKPESSKGFLIVILSGIVSLSFTVIATLLISASNPSIRNPIRLEEFTDLKNIGTLIQTRLDLTKLNQAFQSKRKDKDIETFIQFLRKFRFEVQNSGKSLFLITSTKPFAGKSFTIVNLAYSLSLLNKRVLIIDTNFKSSSLTKLLIPNANETALLRKGFSNNNLLKGNGSYFEPEIKTEAETETDHDESLPNTKNDQNIIHKTYYRDVDIIGNYGGKESPSEILAGKDFGSMLNTMLNVYDYILLEGAALNEYSDTRELIKFIDLIIPVFDADTTLNNLDFDSIKYLKSIETKILGTVLNNAKLTDISL
jgi:Mrp family chromosome partitioning ATPase